MRISKTWDASWSRIGGSAEAEKALRESIAIGDHLPDGVISHQDLLHRIAHTNMYLGYTLGRVGRWREAEASTLGPVAIFERLTADFPDLLSTRWTLWMAELGLVDVFRGNRSPVSRAEKPARCNY